MFQETRTNPIVKSCSECKFSRCLGIAMNEQLRYCSNEYVLREKMNFIKVWGEFPDQQYAAACTSYSKK